MKAQSPREIAIRVLRRRGQDQDYVERLLENELARATLSAPDRGLCQELTYGMARWQMTLDWLVARKTGHRAQNASLRLLLHLGLYQLFWLERIPNHAAVHETVELAKQMGFGAQAGFLNAVLRGYTREHEATLRELELLKKTDLSTGFSHPAWLVERWQARWGTEKTSVLLAWNNAPPSTFARLNTLKTDAGSLMTAWRMEGVDFHDGAWDWTGKNLVFELRAHPPLAKLESFRRGEFYVQDPSTLLAVEELNPQTGETILDLCAAPGGKTTYAGQKMRNQGRIIAQDNQPERLKLVAENCARLGVICVETAAPAGFMFDRILVDAPCSNTGVLRRRVDVRWRIQPEEIERLRHAQAGLLAHAAGQLKAGGTLAYSTCSLEPEENEMVVRDFLERHGGFSLESERQLLPFVEGVDGAYVAKMRRKNVL